MPRAALCSVALHAFFLGAAAVIVPRLPDGGPAPWRLANLWWAEPPIAVTLAEPEKAEDPIHEPTRQQPSLPEAAFANQDAHAAHQDRGLPSPTRRPLTPDQDRDGRPRVAEPSFRRDTATLRDRISDGARHHSPSRKDTGARAASPQAVRQEPRVGIGDSARTTSPRQQLPEVAPPVLPDLPTEAADTPPLADGPARTPDEPGPDDARGTGPLAADPGTVSFDLVTLGALGDQVHVRAASDALAPGLVDYAQPTGVASGEGRGRGPAKTPGVVPVPSPAEASTPQGWPTPRTGHGPEGDGTTEMRYHREHLEITRRIGRALVFPRDLLLRLEQGESIVEFHVEPSGQLAGDVRLVKSARFEGFDTEALAAVRRAAPYPRLPQRMRFRVRIPFENPMVR